MFKSSRFILALAPVFILGCSQDRLEVAEVTETRLGQAGGEAVSAAGDLTVRVPQGTLSADSMLTIETKRGSNDPDVVTPIFDLKVTPPVERFDPPVQITVSVPLTAERIVVANMDGNAPVEVAGSVYNRDDGVVTAPLEHFSSYAGIRQPNEQCPMNPPGPTATCRTQGLRCEYGQECCCGECHPSEVWTCSGTAWAGHNTDACFGPCIDSGVSACPPSPPTGTCPVDGQVCEYGEECCCGECHPALRYRCSGGLWSGHNTDACLGPCPDAG